MDTNGIREAMLAEGYAEAPCPGHPMTYWKSGECGQEAATVVFAGQSIGKAKREVAAQFRGLAPENVSAAVLRPARPDDIFRRGCFFIDGGKAKGKRAGASGSFAGACRRMEAALALEAAGRRARRIPAQPDGAWAVWLLLAALVWGAYRTGFGAWDAYGITGEPGSSEWAMRIATYPLCHAGPRHLLGNISGLLAIGLPLAKRRSGAGILAIWAAAAAAGGYATCAWHGAEHCTIGASGAVYGLAGALAVCAFCGQGTKKGIVRTLLAMLLMGALTPGADTACHFGGMVGGAAAEAAIRGISGTAENVAVIRAAGKARRLAAALCACLVLSAGLSGCGKEEAPPEAEQEAATDAGQEQENGRENTETDGDAAAGRKYELQEAEKPEDAGEGAELSGTEYGELNDAFLRIIDETRDNNAE